MYMVVQKALNNLKESSKDDKVAVASGIAISVVVVLMVAWAILFFHNIQKGRQQLDLSGGVQDQFNFSSVKEAQKQLQQQYSHSTEDFQQLRNDAASRQMQLELQTQMQQTQNGGADQFGTQNPSY